MKEPTMAARVTAVKALRKLGTLFNMRGDMFAADAFGRAISILSTGIGDRNTSVKLPIPRDRELAIAIDVLEYETRRRLGSFFHIPDAATLQEVREYVKEFRKTGKLPPQ